MIAYMIQRQEELRKRPETIGSAIGVISSPYQRDVSMADVYRIERLSKWQHLPAWHIAKQTGFSVDMINEILED